MTSWGGCFRFCSPALPGRQAETRVVDREQPPGGGWRDAKEPGPEGPPAACGERRTPRGGEEALHLQRQRVLELAGDRQPGPRGDRARAEQVEALEVTDL